MTKKPHRSAIDGLQDDPIPRDQSAVADDFSDIPIMNAWIEPEEQKERARDISELPPGRSADIAKNGTGGFPSIRG